MKKVIYSICFCVCLSGAGCYYDKEEALYPATSTGSTTCTTANVTYAATVQNIFKANGCLNCHGVAASGNVSLQTYAGVKAAAANGKLYGAIAHSPGYAPMPQGGAKLSDCNISQIKAWIDAGTPNN